MPPARKYTKEDIIHVTYEMVKEHGFSSVNARSIAKRLGCSVQPIFHNFVTMEQLYEEVRWKIFEVYKDSLLNSKGAELPYKEMGFGYIRFAKDYPEFFKILFMPETALGARNFMMADKVSAEVIQTGQAYTGLSFEQQQQFHLKVWIFTHGIACMVATRTVQFTEDEIGELLTSTVKDLLIGFRKDMK